MEIRTNRITLFVGSRGSGKTFFILKKYIPKCLKLDFSKLILIVDTIDHRDYNNAGIKIININQLGKINSGVARIFGGSNISEILKTVFEKVYNAIVIFEDASKYVNSNVGPDLINFALDSKQKNIDIVFMFHGFNFIPPKILANTDGIMLFRTSSNPDCKKQTLPEYEKVKSAWIKNNNSKNKYPNEYIKIT